MNKSGTDLRLTGKTHSFLPGGKPPTRLLSFGWFANPYG